ncbi:hypothetical protein Lalb_Chr13g0291681 [Lupinus albus]|uniref:Uncharacterized protein n=1 Tax=Lupinus albus TaxID=3870 RepID=A0A6A4PH93_LUPAL|nr:hypothetical protein Lalb_Chr13g0291681 [Lupinus albus]
MEAKPLRSVPSSHNNTYGEGSGPHKKKKSVVVVAAVGDDEVKKRVVDFVVKEENGVGVGSVHTETKPEAINNNTLIQTSCYYYHKCCLFTKAQRGEVYLKVLIFNHFACNLLTLHHYLVA